MLYNFVTDACLLFCVCFSFSVLGQEIGWEERVQNDLFCVWLDIKPQLNQSINMINTGHVTCRHLW